MIVSIVRAIKQGLCAIAQTENVHVVIVPIVTQNHATESAVKTRWANSGDLDYLQEIDITVDWDILKNNKYNIIVAEKGKRIVGFYYFRLTKYSYVVENFIIKHDCRHLGYGKALLKELQQRCVQTHHKMIDILVPEESLDFQKFLRLNQFECISTSGAYHFVWRPYIESKFTQV